MDESTKNTNIQPKRNTAKRKLRKTLPTIPLQEEEEFHLTTNEEITASTTIETITAN